MDDSSFFQRSATPKGTPQSAPVAPAFNPGQMSNPDARRNFSRDQLSANGQEGSGITADERLQMQTNERRRAEGDRQRKIADDANKRVQAEQRKLAADRRNIAFKQLADTQGRPIDRDEYGNYFHTESDDDFGKRRAKEQETAISTAKEKAEKERMDKLNLELKRAKYEADDPAAKAPDQKETEDLDEQYKTARRTAIAVSGLGPDATDDDIEKIRATNPGALAPIDKLKAQRGELESRDKLAKERQHQVRQAEGRILGVIPDEPVSNLDFVERQGEFLRKQEAYNESIKGLDGQYEELQTGYQSKVESIQQELQAIKQRGGTPYDLSQASQQAGLKRMEAEAEYYSSMAQLESARKEHDEQLVGLEVERGGLERLASSLQAGSVTEPETTDAPDFAPDGKTYQQKGDSYVQENPSGEETVMGTVTAGKDGQEVIVAENGSAVESIMRSPSEKPVYLGQQDPQALSDEDVSKKLVTIDKKVAEINATREREWKQIVEQVGSGKLSAKEAEKRGVSEAVAKQEKALTDQMSNVLQDSMVDFGEGRMSAQQFQQVWKKAGQEGSAIEAYKGVEAKMQVAQDGYATVLEMQKKGPQPLEASIKHVYDGDAKAFMDEYFKWLADPSAKTRHGSVPTFEQLKKDRQNFEMKARQELRDKGIEGEEVNSILQRAAIDGWTFRQKDAIEQGSKFSPLDLVGFAHSVPDAIDFYSLAETAVRLEKGQEVGDEEMKRFEDYVIDISRDQTTGAKILETVVAMPAFATELYLTGGVYSAGKAITRKAAMEALERVTKRKATDLLKRKATDGLLKRTTRFALRSGVASAGVVGGATLQTPFSAALRIPTDMYKDMATRGFETGLFEMDKNEMGDFEILVNQGLPGPDIMESFQRSAFDNWVEVVSEHSGGAFDKISDVLLPQAMRGAAIRALKRLNGDKTVSQIRQLAKQAGWNGIIQEMGEERIGEAIRGIGHKATDGAIGEEWKLPTLEQLGIELAAFSIPGGVLGGVNAVHVANIQRPIQQSIKEQKARFEKIATANPESLAKMVNAGFEFQGDQVKPEAIAAGLKMVGGSVESLPGMGKINGTIQQAEQALEQAKATGNSNQIIATQKFLDRLHKGKAQAAINGAYQASEAATALDSHVEQQVAIQTQMLDPEGTGAAQQEIAQAATQAQREVNMTRATLKIGSGVPYDALTSAEKAAIEEPITMDENGEGPFAVDLTDTTNPIVTDEGIRAATEIVGTEVAQSFIPTSESEYRADQVRQSGAGTGKGDAKGTDQGSEAPATGESSTGGTGTGAAGTNRTATASGKGGTTVTLAIPEGASEIEVEKLLQRELSKQSPNELLDTDTIEVTEPSTNNGEGDSQGGDSGRTDTEDDLRTSAEESRSDDPASKGGAETDSQGTGEDRGTGKKEEATDKVDGGDDSGPTERGNDTTSEATTKETKKAEVKPTTGKTTEAKPSEAKPEPKPTKKASTPKVAEDQTTVQSKAELSRALTKIVRDLKKGGIKVTLGRNEWGAAAAADENGIYMDVAMLWEYSQDLTEEGRVGWLNSMVSEEVRHHALRAFLLEEWSKDPSFDASRFSEYREAYFAQIWRDEIVGSAIEEAVRKAYQDNAVGGMADNEAQLGEEAVRMVSQMLSEGKMTEDAFEFAQGADSILLKAIRMAIRAVRALLKGKDLGAIGKELNASVLAIEKQLKKFFPEQSADETEAALPEIEAKPVEATPERAPPATESTRAWVDRQLQAGYTELNGNVLTKIIGSNTLTLNLSPEQAAYAKEALGGTTSTTIKDVLPKDVLKRVKELEKLDAPAIKAFAKALGMMELKHPVLGSFLIPDAKKGKKDTDDFFRWNYLLLSIAQREASSKAANSTPKEVEAARKDVDTGATMPQKEAENYKVGRVKWRGHDVSIENPKESYRWKLDTGALKVISSQLDSIHDPKNDKANEKTARLIDRALKMLGNDNVPGAFKTLSMAADEMDGSEYGFDSAINGIIGDGWFNKMPADYGRILKTEGADGDHVDIFMGPNLDSSVILIVNQKTQDVKPKFDEHKILAGFNSRHEAMLTYRKSYGADWRQSGVDFINVSGAELDAWLESGDTTKPYVVVRGGETTTPEAKPSGKRLTKEEGEHLFGSYSKTKEGFLRAYERELKATHEWARNDSEKLAKFLDNTRKTIEGKGSLVNLTGSEAAQMAFRKIGLKGRLTYKALKELPSEATEKPKAPENQVSGDKPIGKNSKGQDVYEDHNKVRFVLEDGFQIFESIEIIPGKGSVRQGGARWETVDEATEKPKAPESDQAVTAPGIIALAKELEPEAMKEAVESEKAFAKRQEEQGMPLSPEMKADGLTVKALGLLQKHHDTDPRVPRLFADDTAQWQAENPRAAEREKETSATESVPISETPELSPEEQALKDLLDDVTGEGGKPAAVADPSRRERYNTPFPVAKFSALLGVIGGLVESGKGTPEALAETLTKINYRQFSESVWGAVTAIDTSAPKAPDWSAIYGAMDAKPEETPSGTEAVIEQIKREAAHANAMQASLAGGNKQNAIIGLTSEIRKAGGRWMTSLEGGRANPAMVKWLSNEFAESAAQRWAEQVWQDREQYLDTGNTTEDLNADEDEPTVRGGNSGKKQGSGARGNRPKSTKKPSGSEDVGDGMPDSTRGAKGGGDSSGDSERDDESGSRGGTEDAGGSGGKSGENGDRTDSTRPGDRGGIPKPPRNSPGRSNYFLSDPEAIVGGGPKTRFARNKKALEVADIVMSEDREPTSEEMDALAAYTGWGAFGQELFNGSWERGLPKQEWKDEDAWLRDHLGEKGWKSAQDSILNAHYTDPPTVSTIWEMLRTMGFRGGRVLEPAEGIGNFWALMPPDLSSASDKTAIELDRATYDIAKILHPDTNHFRMGYEESSTPDDFYDLIIGNWPFKKGGPSDRRYNRLNASLHNYFFLKAIDQVRPGGLVVGITSHMTMDSKGAAHRRYLASRGELVAAFRLPSGAFGKYAGTKVVTDLIILRKREKPLESVEGIAWVDSVDDPMGRDMRYNQYFIDNPSHVLGTIDYGHGTTSGKPGLIVHRGEAFPDQLAALPGLVPTDAFREWEPPSPRATTVANLDPSLRQNALVIKDGDVFRVAGEQLELVNDISKWKVTSEKTNQARVTEFESLIKIRDLQGDLMAAYQTGGNATEAREAMKGAYEEFKKKHKGGLRGSKMLKIMDKLGDPGALVLWNLEDENGKPRAIFTKDIMRPKAPEAAGSIKDAYAIQRNNSLRFHLDQVAEIAGASIEDVQKELVDLNQIYQLPTGEWEAIDEYLSGNVRRKLREAKAAKQQGIEWLDRNIEALEAVQPKSVYYSDIEVRMGASWVDKSDYLDFFNHLLNVPDEHRETTEVVKQATGWRVKVDYKYSTGDLARKRWGTNRLPFASFAGAAMNGTSVAIYDELVIGKSKTRVLNTEATEAANAKIEAIQEEFQQWIWSDANRIARLSFEYNEAFTSTINPKRDGSHLRFEGLALTLGSSEFDFRKHQRDAVWRFLQDGRGVAFHEVGTGKTFTMAGLAVEGRRLGRFRKPLLFAHNANHETVAAEFRMAYPGARILHFDSISAKDRASKLRQIQLDEWDAVIVPHSMIDKFTLKRETMEALVEKEIKALEDEFWAEIDDADEGNIDRDSINLDDMASVMLALARKPGVATAKDLAKSRARIRERIEKRMASLPADAVFFEDLGVDAVMVDEAHIFKKISLATRKKVKGLQTQESGRGFSLGLLTDWVKAQNSGRGVFTFTGTPVTNALNEVYNMMKFVMDDQMADSGIDSFDDWFNSFAATTTEIELTSGNTYEPVDRLLSFINVPELARMAGRSFDVVLASNMPEFLPRDNKDGLTEDPIGRPFKEVITEIAEMSTDQAAHKEEIKRRYHAFQKLDGKTKLLQMRSGGDSPLIMEGEGSKAALDYRMVDPDATDFEGSKVNQAVKNILSIFNESDRASQMVFLESGFADYADRKKKMKDATGMPLTKPSGEFIYETKRVKLFNIGRDMIEKLVAGGIRPEEIAVFSNMRLDPVSDREDDILRRVQKISAATGKEDLAAMMRDGTIKVAFGGSETLGTGVNAQTYLRAMHHLDAPWMPGHLEQRNGRGHRQGNKWNTVKEFRYVTEGSHDGRRWQILLNKVRFIQRFTEMLQGGTDVRVLEGDGADTSEGGSVGGFEETFSSAAGDPRLLLKANIEKQVQKLERKKDTHLRAQLKAGSDISDAKLDIVRLKDEIQRLEKDAKAWDDRPEDFSIQVEGKTYTTRAEANDALDRLPAVTPEKKTVARFLGFSVINYQGGFGSINIKEVIGLSGDEYWLTELSTNSIEGLLRNFGKRIDRAKEEIAAKEQSIESLSEMADKPFARDADIKAKKEALAQILSELQLSPAPAPGWLRHGVPPGSIVYVNGKTLDVAAHRWDAKGYWVMVEDGGNIRPVKYDEVTDEMGTRLLPDHEFTPPPSNEQEKPSNPDSKSNPAQVGRPPIGGQRNTDGNSQDEIEAIESAINELLGIMPDQDLIKDLRGIAQNEPTGERTIGNPDIANPVMDERGRRDFDAVRAAYEGQLNNERETEQQWIDEARRNIKENRVAVIDRLLDKALTDKVLDKWETKAAQILINELRAEAYATNNADLHRNVDVLTYAYQKGGTEMARAFRARRDVHKTPAQRHLDFFNQAIVHLSEDQERIIDNAWDPGAKRRKLKKLEDDLRAAKENVNPERISELQREIREVKMKADKMDLRSRLLAKRNAEIKRVLRDGYGVTMQEIFNGDAVVRLRGSKIVQRVLDQNFNATEIKALRDMIDGDGDRTIARHHGLGRKLDMPQLENKFRRLMRTRFTELAKRGFTLDDFTKGDDRFFGPARVSRTPKSVDEETVNNAVQAMMDALFVDSKVRNSGRVKKIDSAGTGKTAKGKPLPRKRVDIGDREQAVQLHRAVQAELDSNGLDMLYEYWISNILSGPQTQVVNIAGNSANMLFEYAFQKPLEASWNLIVKDPNSAQFGEFKHMRKALPGIYAKAYYYAKSAWAAEVSFFDVDHLNAPMDISEERGKLEGRKPALPDRFGKIGTDGGRSLPGAIAGAASGKGWSGVSVGKTVRIPGRALLFFDAFFKSVGASIEVHAQAYRIGKGLGLSGSALDDFMGEQQIPGSESWHAAVQKARELTFTNPLRTAKDGGGSMEAMAKALLDVKNKKKLGAVAAFSLGLFFPFVQTPFRIFQAGLRRTPLGLLGAMKLYTEGMVSMRNGVPFTDTVSKARMVRDLADQTIAWTTTALIWSAVEGDPDDDDKLLLITGSHPYGVEGTAERDASQRINGGPYMIRFGDRKTGVTFDYGRIEPLATTLASIVDLLRSKKRLNAGSPLDVEIATMVHSSLAQTTDKTFLKGLASIWEFIQSPERKAEGIPKFLASAIVPNLIRQPLRNMDEYGREYRTAPWYYHALPVGDFAAKKIDIYGNPVRKGETPLAQWAKGTSFEDYLKAADPMLRLLWDVGYRADEDVHPMDAAMRQFQIDNPGEEYWPSRNYIDRYRDPMTDELDKPMTREEFEFFNVIAGQELSARGHEAMTELDRIDPTDETVQKVKKVRSGVFPEIRNQLFDGGVPPTLPKPKAKSIAESLGIK